MSKFEKYSVQLTLIRDQLGTNPCDPNVLDTHILDRQRKLILEQSGINKEINKYLAQIPISKEKGEAEVDALFSKLEELTGVTLTGEERAEIMTGNLQGMKETFAELDVKGTTVFFWDKEKALPKIGDHMIGGFLKAAAEAVARTLPKKNGTMLHSTSHTQSMINQYVRCENQFITFDRDVKRDDKGEVAYLQRSLRAETAKGPRVSLAKSEIVEAGAVLDFVLKVWAGSPVKEEHLRELFDYGELSGLGQWRNTGYGQFTYKMKKLG